MTFLFVCLFRSLEIRINCRMRIELKDIRDDLFEKDEQDINNDTNMIYHHDHRDGTCFV
jgi:hypothetical protein